LIAQGGPVSTVGPRPGCLSGVLEAIVTALARPLPPQPSAENLWERLLDRLTQDGKEYALNWLGKMQPLEVREDALVLAVPDRFYQDWVDDHYRHLLESTLAKVTDSPTQVAYEVVPGLAPPPELKPAQAVKSNGARPPRLNARFTFQNFVVADSNQLAAAAAQAVADTPGRAYNPLYIYGGTGLGKTHLLHAIGNKIWDRDPAQRVVYLSSEQFTNEYIESVREQRMPEFRRKFREECDVLMIDDVQFLGRKEETQREFFHTFNTLHEQGKAIILTSDMVPAEVPGLEERLRSRFSMGLITDIQEPSFETRVAILQKKAVMEGLDLPDEVAHFIARAFQKNVRELEGALVKVSAIHSLSRHPVTVDFASHVLKDVLPSRQVVDVESIQKEVARYYKVPVEALKEDRRHKALAHARQVAMYLSRKLTKGSFPEIAARFNKDHSTVISAVRKVEKLRETDTAVKRELDELEAKLTGE
jgi:chromosomal replication initiator protein